MATVKQDSNEPYIVITCEEAFANEAKKPLTAEKDPLASIWGQQGTCIFSSI